ncbi:HAMP domain-containing protein [Nesterenkonia sp. E16_7]|uniref:ATP-binding protein n=1 Tax=unclassified Nesterenkonia TaxID=2629769 RepID=UPI001A92A974|nr:HAMP domain-containing protein [Nesterenkonia sp. E16_10]MBO0599920.1 HAMP domain-containing protein [Nesterenkonia sp. E16_7]
MKRRLAGSGLGTRIFGALIVVLCVATVTAWLVALVIGPRLFHDHMLMVSPAEPDSDVVAHAEEAFDSAWQTSLMVALLAALATSIFVTVFMVRRLVHPIHQMRAAVTKVAEGDFTTRVPEGGIGVEFAQLMSAFNTMADELDQTERTRTRLLADLAHELRTPVATLDGYLEAIQDGVASADTETLVMLRGQTDRLTRLAEDISLVSAAEERRLSMHPAPTRIGSLLTAAQSQTRSRYETHGVELHVSASEDAQNVVLRIDADRMGQVLTNLLDNALQHTDPGDTVTLCAEATDVSLTLKVQDSGHGIATEHLPHIFERFYRVDTARDRTHGGSGIGLAIVHSIAAAHSGKVRVHSDGPGKGTVFTVDLPRHTTDTVKVQ